MSMSVSVTVSVSRVCVRVLLPCLSPVYGTQHTGMDTDTVAKSFFMISRLMFVTVSRDCVQVLLPCLSTVYSTQHMDMDMDTVTDMDADMASAFKIIKMTLRGIYAILSCFLMYEIKIGLETDTTAVPGHRHSIGIGIG